MYNLPPLTSMFHLIRETEGLNSPYTLMHPSTPSNNYKRSSSCLFIFVSSLVSLSMSDPRTSEAGLYCGNTTTTTTTLNPSNSSTLASKTLIPTFVKVMEGLSQAITTTHFATYNKTIASFTLYALAQCHVDLSQTDCLLCFAASRTILPRCLPSPSSRIYLDGCFLRYDDYEFYREYASPGSDNVECGAEGFASPSGSVAVGAAVGNVTNKALEGEGLFGVVRVKEGGESVYALGQCWESVGKKGCRECLKAVGKAVLERCSMKKEGRGMNLGCYLRYSINNFYGDHSSHDHGNSRTRFIVASVSATAAFLLFSLSMAYLAYTRLSKTRQERKNLGKASISFNKSGLSFKYEALEKATNYFTESRKIGEGGHGSVYRGTLQDGRVVAVKRLIFNTGQWVDEFFNEVNLISGITHKNLVKLLGCSIEGPESLLVYEYVSNNSLDHFLFDKKRSTTLNWKQRYDIMVGTAEGVAYLHEGCEMSIIHRDIKSSNVLLDENFAPKVADFGLVRCFGADKSHLTTGIAGTMGYIAPEYLIRGQLTKYVDVYSYGVLVLEIVTGKRCNHLMQFSSSLLQTVWQLYKSDRLVEAVDPSLGHDFPAQEASGVLRIGLLCTQALVALRPSMSEVVRMLAHCSDPQIPVPTQPPFLNGAHVLGPGDSKTIGSCSSTSNPVSNGATRIEGGCCTFSESSGPRSSDGPSSSRSPQ